MPGLYGYVSATKWLKEIELTTWEAFDGYWVPLGWSKTGPILTQSRIDVPRRDSNVPAGQVTVAWVNLDTGAAQVALSHQAYRPVVAQPLDVEAHDPGAEDAAMTAVESVEDAGICTRCERETFFSHRGDGPGTGRQAGIAWMTN